MPNDQLRSLRATELKLLQERTKLQRRLEESMSAPKWEGETVQELNQRLEQLEAELYALRAEMRRVDREDVPAD